MATVNLGRDGHLSVARNLDHAGNVHIEGIYFLATGCQALCLMAFWPRALQPHGREKLNRALDASIPIRS